MKNAIRNFLIILLISYSYIAKAQFAGGTGTASDPWQIATAEQLNSVRNYLGSTHSNKHFKLIANINLGTTPWNEGEGWVPIGQYSNKFQGYLNGNGFLITGFYINRPSSNYQGLFGATSYATIFDLGLTNISIVGKDFIGGLVGSGSNTTISTCFTTGIINGWNKVGGLLGQSISSSITYNSYSMINIISHGVDAGGFVGNSDYYAASSFLNCYSTGSVSGTYMTVIGGFNGGFYVDATNCFWDTETSHQSNSTGGTGKTTLEMKNFATYISALWNFKGYGTNGVWNIGNDRNNGYPYLNWQYPNDPVHQPQEQLPVFSSSSLSNITSTSVLCNATFYSGNPFASSHGFCWNTTGNPTINDSKTEEGPYESINGSIISTITELTPNTQYFIRAYATNTLGTNYGEELLFFTYPIDPIMPEGSGTPSTPYLISNLNNLFWLSLNRQVNYYYFLQTNDINASETANWYQGKGFSPIHGFKGHYNGNNFNIYNLFIVSQEQYGTGLFSQLGGMSYDAAKITNLGLINVNITGPDYVGALVGYVSGNCIISNCYSSGVVNGTTTVGGLIGSNQSSVSNCYSYAQVNGVSYIGGLIGYAGSPVTKCYSIGNVFGTENVGGLIGCSSTTVSNSYSISNVTGNKRVGGLIGIHGQSTVSKCYSTGKVTGVENVGGFVGTITGGTVTGNCYWNTETSEQTTSAGGTGLTTSQMLQQNNFTDWDFSEVWKIYQGYSYPFLNVQGGAYEWNYPLGTTLHPLSLSAHPYNGGTLKGSGYYPGDVEVSITATPKQDFKFVQWENTQGDVLSESATYTITMPNIETTVIAKFAEIAIDAEIFGDTAVCNQSVITYNLSRSATDIYKWFVIGGEIVSSSNSSIKVKWQNGTEGNMQLIEYQSNKWAVIANIDITIKPKTVNIVPEIHRKGDLNILICTSPNLSYKWFYNGEILDGQTGQYYIAGNNVGSYLVQIKDSDQCPNQSAEFDLGLNTKSVNTISIYPNPSSGEFKLEVSADYIGKGTVSIVNSFGNILYMENIEKTDISFARKINLYNLPKGIYIVSFQIENKQPLRQKLTVN